MLPYRWVFVGGLHRSGTSLLTKVISAHPDVASIGNAPVPENEGVYLQGAIPHTAMHGRPMHFATDPLQHHVEGSRFDRQDVRDRLLADWDPWYAPARWRVEKSPVNLIRTRLYQQLFPLSQFILVIRHPEIVAAATSKWTGMPPSAAIDHWISAHTKLKGDLPHLHAVFVLRYEDFIDRPHAWSRALFAFLSLEPVAISSSLRDGNADYPNAEVMSVDQTTKSAEWGYGPGGAVLPFQPPISHSLRSVRDAVLAKIAQPCFKG